MFVFFGVYNLKNTFHHRIAFALSVDPLRKEDGYRFLLLKMRFFFYKENRPHGSTEKESLFESADMKFNTMSATRSKQKR